MLLIRRWSKPKSENLLMDTKGISSTIGVALLMNLLGSMVLVVGFRRWLRDEKTGRPLRLPFELEYNILLHAGLVRSGGNRQGVPVSVGACGAFESRRGRAS